MHGHESISVTNGQDDNPRDRESRLAPTKVLTKPERPEQPVYNVLSAYVDVWQVRRGDRSWKTRMRICVNDYTPNDIHRGLTHHVNDGALSSTKQGVITTSKHSIVPNAFRNLPMIDDRHTLDLYLDAIISIVKYPGVMQSRGFGKQSMTSNGGDGLEGALDVATGGSGRVGIDEDLTWSSAQSTVSMWEVKFVPIGKTHVSIARVTVIDRSCNLCTGLNP